MSTHRKDVSVNIMGETFSLAEIPDVRSQMVKCAVTNLVGSVDLDSLATDLGKLGNYIRIAYYGVAGSTKLQIEVQEVGYKITKLADKSAVTVHKFKSASNSVLQELQGTYAYLLDGLEEMALENLSLLSKVAEQMAEAAEELRTDFEAATTDVKNALTDTQLEKGCREDWKKKMEDEQKEFEIRRKKAEALQKQAIQAEEKFNKLYIQAQEREDEALASEGGILKTIANIISSCFGAGVSLLKCDLKKFGENVETMASNSFYKDAKNQANKEKMKHLDDVKKQMEIRMEANQQCIEFAERIKNCKDDENLANVAIDALHKSVGALKSLSAVMMKAALFWRQMQEHCKAIAEHSIKQKVKNAMKFPKEIRIKTWTSTGFKRDAILYYSMWVALDYVCGICTLQIKETRKDLYAYLQENPTIEQSRKEVRRLAESFSDDLQLEQKKIAEKVAKE